MLYWGTRGDTMKKEKLNSILAHIAAQNNTTIQEVRREMELAMRAGQSSTDPAVQALWRSIPRKGSQLALEELIEYLSKKALRP